MDVANFTSLHIFLKMDRALVENSISFKEITHFTMIFT